MLAIINIGTYRQNYPVPLCVSLINPGDMTYTYAWEMRLQYIVSLKPAFKHSPNTF